MAPHLHSARQLMLESEIEWLTKELSFLERIRRLSVGDQEASRLIASRTKTVRRRLSSLYVTVGKLVAS